MKKTIAMLSIAALALSATTAFAHGPNMDHGMKVGLWDRLGTKIEKHFTDSSKFVLTGTVVSTTSSSVTVTVKGSVNVTVANNQATVNVTSDTKITKDKNQTLALSDIKAGDQIVVTGSVSGTTLTATNIRVVAPHGTAFGTVSATSANSITINNAKTGVSQTFTINGDTKVMVDGQASTVSDVQVGDKGFVKFKSDVSGLVAKLIGILR